MFGNTQVQHFIAFSDKMAVAATPRNEIENKLRLGRLVDLSNDVLHQVLSIELQKAYPGLFDPNTGGFLFQVLNNQKAKHSLQQLELSKVLNVSQMKLLYPNGNPSKTVTIQDLDITLTVVFLRNITNLNPKAKWYNPPVGDKSMQANIGRVKKFRNEHMHGSEGLSDTRFQAKFTELKSLLLSLSTLYSSDYYDKLLTDPLHTKGAPCDLLSTKLPCKNPDFKGRTDLVKEIQEHIAGDSSLILLTGMGGIGKTSVAIEVGHQFKDVMYIDMRKVTNLESVKLSIVQHYHPNQFLKDIYSDYQNIFTKTMSDLATNTLLILDNNDSVLDTHKQEFLQLLQDIMTSTSQITLLCTSRESFNLLSHKTFLTQVSPLDEKSSLEILWQDKTNSPTESESADLRKIAQRCGQNPLALKLLAIQLKSKQVKHLLNKMERNPTVTVLQLPNSNEGMLACLDLSYETLNPKEQKVFRGLHIFQVAFSLEEVSNILDTENDECESILENIMSKSLLSLDQHIYDLHPLVREYADIKAQVERAEMSQTQNRYCAYFITYLSSFEQHLQTALKSEKLTKLVPHLNITADFLLKDLCNCNKSQKKVILSNLEMIANAFQNIYLLQRALSIYQTVANEMETGFPAGHFRLIFQYNLKFFLRNDSNLELTRILRKIGTVLHQMGRYKEALEFYKKCLVVREELLGNKHPGTALSNNNIGAVLRDMGEYKEALEYHKKCLEVREELLGNKHPDTATTYNNIGGVLRGMGAYKEALEYHKKCLAVREELLGNKHPDTATTYNNIGAVLRAMGEYKEALEYHKKCLVVREELLGNKHPDTALSNNNIGAVLRDMGEYKEALEYRKKCLVVREELLGNKHPHTASSYNNIGAVLREMGEYKKALEYHKKCLVVREELLGDKHPDTANTYSNIGIALYDMGEYNKALKYHKKCLAVREELLGIKHPHTATTYNNIGVVLHAMSEYKEALEYHKKCLVVREELLGNKHPDTASSYTNIGCVLRDMGEYKEALEYHKKCLVVMEEHLGNKHSNRATSYNNIGAVLHEMGEYKEALEYLKKCLVVREELLVIKHPHTASSYNNIGVVLHAMSEYKEALEYHMKSFDIRKAILGPDHPATIQSSINIESLKSKVNC